MPPDLSDSSAQTAAKERSAHSDDASRAPDPSAEADHGETAHNADPAANPGQDQFSAALAGPRSDSSEPNIYESCFGVQYNSKSSPASRRCESHAQPSSESQSWSSATTSSKSQLRIPCSSES